MKGQRANQGQRAEGKGQRQLQGQRTKVRRRTACTMTGVVLAALVLLPAVASAQRIPPQRDAIAWLQGMAHVILLPVEYRLIDG